MQFFLLSQGIDTPSVFSLSFIVSNGPPTTVNCTVNGSVLSTEVSRAIVNGTGFITRVTVTSLTEAGSYQCTVSNARVTANGNGIINDVQAVSSTSSLSVSG